MPINLGDREIEKVLVVDDDPEVRSSYEYTLEDVEVEPVLQVGPLPDLDAYQRSIVDEGDAALCDHHLQVANYATFDGAQLAAHCFTQGFPAILCTNWEQADIDRIRLFRDRIPVVLRQEDLTPTALVEALEVCISELDHGPNPERKPWHTPVHVLELDTDLQLIYVELPGWESDEVIKLPFAAIPSEFISHLSSDLRCYALVNIGAGRQEELFFKNWSLD